MEPIRVLLVDDQHLILECLRARLVTEPDIMVVGEATNGDEAIQAIERLHPDVVLMDIRMPVRDGLAATQDISAGQPDLGIIILTADEANGQVFQAMKNGARGYLGKDCTAAELVQAIRAVARGGTAINLCVTVQMLKEFKRSWQQAHAPMPDILSAREVEVLRRIARGASNKEISVELSIAERTVKKSVTSILQKLGVRDRTQAVSYAAQHGLHIGNDH